MKRPQIATLIATLFCALMIVMPLTARGQQPPPGVDPKADEVLRRMADVMKQAKTVSFEAHAIADQLSPEGEKLQFAKNQKVKLRHPDKLAADVIGDQEDLQFRYNGKQVTLYNPRTNSFGTVDAPASIEDTLDLLAQKYGVAIPLADLVFADPYSCLMEHVRSGQYVGEGYVLDTKCHHLAFRQASVDWQIWIDEGEKPLPRKIVITFKESPGHLQYSAFLSNWNLAADVTDADFEFSPPAGAKKVEFAPATQPATGAK